MTRWTSYFTMATAGLFLLGGCVGEISTYEEGHGDDTIYDEEMDAELAELEVLYAGSATVQDVMWSSCSTAVVRGLSDQLVDEIECLRPGTLKSIANIPGVNRGSAVFPYLQTPAADALRAAMSAGGTITVNSALRSLAQQFILYQWYLNGRCGVSLAARPGKSNHERGLAIDVSNASTWRSRLEGKGYRWLGASDPVHFDYVSGGVDLAGLSVKAFQRLWNANHPNDKITVDGLYGPQTEARLKKSPAAGFNIGSTCGANTQPVEIKPMAVEWRRQSDGSYNFGVDAPNGVNRVKYTVEGYQIGSVTRSQAGEHFVINYTFNYEIYKRGFKAEGYNADGVKIAEGIGLIDSVPGTGVFIWQRADQTYTVGVERAPANAYAIELRVDGTLITDSISGETRSTRMAVRRKYNVMGPRHFQVKVFNANGSVIATYERDFTLK